METLQKRKLRHNKRPQSQPHALENITIALDAIQEDGIKLVNIGEPWFTEVVHNSCLDSALEYPKSIKYKVAKVERWFLIKQNGLDVGLACDMV